MKKFNSKMLCITVVLVSFLTQRCQKSEYVRPVNAKKDSVKTNKDSSTVNHYMNNYNYSTVTNPNGTNTVTPNNNNTNIVTRPVEANWQTEAIEQPTPPSGYPYVTAWAQAVEDTYQDTALSTVEVDYLELWAVVNGKDQLVCQNRYDSYDSESKWFGLYSRRPWFPKGDAHTQMPVTFTSDGYLYLNPSSAPNNVWHWWITGNPRAQVPSGAQRIWVRMKFRITGPALVQIGADFYDLPANGSNKEFGASDWYSQSSNWQTVVLGTPAN